MICYNAVKRTHVVEKEWDNIKKNATENNRRKRKEDKRSTQKEILKRFGVMKLRE